MTTLTPPRLHYAPFGPPRSGPDVRPLEGSVALITGGGRGIGRILARGLADAGAAVGLLGRYGPDLAEAVSDIRASGGIAASARADVTDHRGLAVAVAQIEYVLGPIDLLVNNAGLTGPIGPLWEVDHHTWWTAIDVNLRGTLLASQLVLPGMVARRRGRIINLSSQAGVHRWPLVSAYSVSKAAVTKLTENLAHETQRHGVSVFSVHPGLLPIGMSETLEAHRPETVHEATIRSWTLGELADGRGADPGDALALLLRLASGEADSLTGRHLSVHDDLDDLLARVNEIRDCDLYVLRPEHLRKAS